MSRAKGFADLRNRDLARALWSLPTGETVLVYEKPFGGGFLLYQEQEWKDNSEPLYQADKDGQVLRQDQYVAYQDSTWIVPVETRRHAVRN